MGELIAVAQALGFPAWAVVVLVMGVLLLRGLSRIGSEIAELRSEIAHIKGWIRGIAANSARPKPPNGK